MLNRLISSKNIAVQICEVLQKYKIQSLIIEGGSQTLQTFIDAKFGMKRMFILELFAFMRG